MASRVSHRVSKERTPSRGSTASSRDAREELETWEVHMNLEQLNTPDRKINQKEMQHAIAGAARVSFATPGRYTLDPTKHSWIGAFDMCLGVAILYTAALVPVELAFLMRNRHEVQLLSILDTVANLAFVIDMVLQFFLHYRRPLSEGAGWIRNHRHIVLHYVKGNFLFDLISCLPVGILVLAMHEPRFKIRHLRTVRLLKLLRLGKLWRVIISSNFVRRFRSQLSMSQGLADLISFVALILLLCHLFACIWGFVANTSSPDLTNNWMTQFLGGSVKWNIRNPLNQYLISLYFAIMTLTTVGFGDVTPTNRVEYGVVVCAMFLGGLIWAYVIGEVCAIASTLDIKKIEHRQMFDKINRVVSDLGVDRELASSIRNYLFHSEQMWRKSNLVEIINYLSPQLQGDLCDTFSRRNFTHVQYLGVRSVSRSFRLAVVKVLDSRMFCPNETVKDRDLMIVADTGLIAADGAIATLGMAINRDFICHTAPRRLTRSISYAWVYRLDRPTFFRILDDFPADKPRVHWFRVMYALVCLKRRIRLVKKRARRRSSESSPSTERPSSDDDLLAPTAYEVVRRLTTPDILPEPPQRRSSQFIVPRTLSARLVDDVDHGTGAPDLGTTILPPDLRDDFDCVAAAVARDYRYLASASATLRSDPDIIARAIDGAGGDYRLVLPHASGVIRQLATRLQQELPADQD